MVEGYTTIIILKAIEDFPFGPHSRPCTCTLILMMMNMVLILDFISTCVFFQRGNKYINIQPEYIINGKICDYMKKPSLSWNYIFDYINAIILLGNEFNGLVIWNPTIREHKVVIEPPPCSHLPSNAEYSSTTFAFGYDQNCEIVLHGFFFFLMKLFCMCCVTIYAQY